MTTQNNARLDEALAALAAAPSLLVCLDFDGTLSEHVTDPYAASAHPAALTAIADLASQPGTQVAVLSGRHLEGLRAVFPLRDPVVLVGSHGAEPTEGGPELSAADAAYLDRIESELRRIATPPAYVEVKPYQRVLHVAPVVETDPAAAEAILKEGLSIDTEGRPVTPGHNLVEFSALDVSKGDWLAEYKRSFDVTFFAGDDTTDEFAMAALGPNDVGIKVGEKPSVATLRVPTVTRMAHFLTELASARRAAQPSRPE
ncbi:trehalose-phosphatase [Corynebacterium sp.]|uniref:trehalose-phosphatase n=1 Tax=Corynebacterium sp. TaxID=1720 RepID=UPI002A9192A3|nr:trehalose-phosphatase [Corynebacterium sp.]MDY5785286.1 trehalose-phosphatase [Corynebacterium sp.]